MHCGRQEGSRFSNFVNDWEPTLDWNIALSALDAAPSSGKGISNIPPKKAAQLKGKKIVKKSAVNTGKLSSKFSESKAIIEEVIGATVKTTDGQQLDLRKVATVVPLIAEDPSVCSISLDYQDYHRLPQKASHVPSKVNPLEKFAERNKGWMYAGRVLDVKVFPFTAPEKQPLLRQIFLDMVKNSLPMKITAS